MNYDIRPREIVFLSAVRSAFGTMGGALKDLTATDIAVPTAKAALERAGVAPDQIGHVVYGNVLQTANDAIYLPRHIGLKVGVPQEVPALAVNRLCGSGFQAVVTAAEQILTGQADVVLAGGTENMSMAPHVVYGMREGARFGKPPKMQDLLWECLTDTYTGNAMAITAETLGKKYGITRDEVDAFALESQRRWKEAQDAGRFADEIAPITLQTRKGEKVFAIDEHPRPETTLDGLAKLPPVFEKNGLVTAGNASGIGDGAGSMVIADAEWAAAKGLKPIARLVSWGIAGVDPKIMGIGPAPAARKALERAGLGLDHMALIEVNEAFAPQYLAVEKELGLDRSITNVNGGAIALAHPLGASGARITATAIHELRRRKEHYALVSACIGGGQGIALIVEALP